MPITCLGIVEYDESGWKWHSHKVVDPTWIEIEEAIRRLDRFRFPFVHLFNSVNDEDLLEDCLNIVGGDGAYWVGLSCGEHEELRLFDSEKRSEKVDLWTSDQGFSDFEFHTTDDVELVLRIARHFAETGEPLPEGIWEF